MPLVIINRNAPDSHELIRLRKALRDAQETAEYLNEVGANATDANLETVFGVPAASGAVFRAVISNLVTALQDNSIDNFISNIG